MEVSINSYFPIFSDSYQPNLNVDTGYFLIAEIVQDDTPGQTTGPSTANISVAKVQHHATTNAGKLQNND